MKVKKGVITAITTGGPQQQITGLGFQPKAVIFFGSGQAADGFATVGSVFLGCATSSTERWCFANVADDNLSASDTARRWETTRCIVNLTDATTPTSDGEADFVSMDADGFTITWSTLPSTAIKVHYLALGGTDLTNAKAITFATGTATGTPAITVTGVGFQGECGIFVSPNFAGTTGPTTSVHLAIGAATGAAAQWVSFVDDPDGQGDNVPIRYQRSGQCLTGASAGNPAIEDFRGVFNAWTADGFTIDVDNSFSSSRTIGALILAGGDYAVGQDTQGTATGANDSPALGFNPAGVLFVGVNAATSAAWDNTTSDRAKLTIGAGDGTDEGHTWWNSLATTGNSNTNRRHSETKALSHASARTTVDAEADLTLGTGKFTLDWTTADAVAREFGYVAFGPAEGGGGGSPPTNTVAPAVTGHEQVGQELTSDSGSWDGSPTSFDYVWERADDSGFTTGVETVRSELDTAATSDDYTLAAGDENHYIRCRVTATNGDGDSSPASSNVVGPVGLLYTGPPAGTGRVEVCGNAVTSYQYQPISAVAPAVTGSPVVGETLAVSDGDWDASPAVSGYTYQWQTSPDGAGSWTNLAGATNDTYLLTADEETEYIRCQVTATNSRGSTTADSNVKGPVTLEPVAASRRSRPPHPLAPAELQTLAHPRLS